MKISEVLLVPNMSLHCQILLSPTAGCTLGFRCVTYLMVVILAKLEGVDDLAFFCQYYVIELSPGLALGSLGSTPDVSLIDYESG